MKLIFNRKSQFFFISTDSIFVIVPAIPMPALAAEVFFCLGLYNLQIQFFGPIYKYLSAIAYETNGAKLQIKR